MCVCTFQFKIKTKVSVLPYFIHKINYIWKPYRWSELITIS